MPKDYPRTLRVGEQLRRELAQLIRNEVKDPRVGDVTVLDAEVSKDLGHARVYFSVLPGQEGDVEACTQGLQRAAGFLRRELGRRLRLRSIPELHFVYDATEDRAHHLESLIADSLAHLEPGSEDEEQ